MEKITVQNTSVMIISINKNDYISLTDIAKYKSDDPTAVIGNWMRNRNTIEYLGIWESLYNPNFKPLEFEGFKKEAGLNAFTLSPQKWINTTAAIGIISKSGSCLLYTSDAAVLSPNPEDMEAPLLIRI